MSDWNELTLTGRLVKDAELKYTQKGTPCLTFALAVNSSKKDASGQWQDEVSYFDCILYGKQAESQSSHLIKGVPVGIKGSLKQERWTDKQGIKRSTVRIWCSSVQRIDHGNAAPAGHSQTATEPEPDRFDDDGIPF